MPSSSVSPVERKLILSGAALFVVGLFTGIWSAAALTGTVSIPLPRLALSTHLNALLGGMWVILVALTFPYLSYNETQQKRLGCLVSIPAWANWGVTLVASFLGVNGLTYSSNKANNAIAFLLQVLVVLPSLIGGVYWVRGFFSRRQQ